MIFYSLESKGFSLVEVLVAISILLLVITGPMTMISRSNNSTAFATEQITAFFLAQEGLELVQMQRDDLLLEFFNGSRVNPWADFQTYFNECTDANGCSVQIEDTNNPDVLVGDCSTPADCRLHLDTTPSRLNFIHGGSNLSLFTRVVNLEFFPGGSGEREVKVTSTVSWRTGSLISKQEVVSVTYLFNVYATS